MGAGLAITIEEVRPVPGGEKRADAKNARFDIRFSICHEGEVIHTLVWRDHLAYRGKDDEIHWLTAGTLPRKFSQKEMAENAFRKYTCTATKNRFIIDPALWGLIGAAIKADPWINQFSTQSLLTPDQPTSPHQKAS